MVYTAASPITSADVVRKASDAAFGKPLITNVLRGQIAEAIIALALEPDWNWCSADYASWDFEHGSGLRLEVKQSAARQSWALEGAAPSVCSFDIAARKGRWEGSTWIPDPRRHADLYVFAHHRVAEPSADHRDPDQWDFYVVASRDLPDTKRISLARLRTMTAAENIIGLAERVAAVAAVAGLPPPARA